MNAVFLAEALPPDVTLDLMIARHGRRRVLAALLGALFRRKPKPARLRPVPRSAPLSDHLRRDIGLPQLPPPRHRDF